MGPYCNFCDRRCFVPLPEHTPPEALLAYGRSTIVATCPEGQRFEMEKTGWCYDKINEAIVARDAEQSIEEQADQMAQEEFSRNMDR